ncbi:MAG: hypothetical protein GXZ08_05330 [Tissierellia bacterium]|nr:hypothetical protein [Tissierellia bacterium]
MNKDNTTKYSRDEFDEALEESDDIEDEFYDEDLENFVLTEMDFENSKEEDEDKISFTKQLTNITKKFAAGIRNFFSAIVSFFVNLFNSIKSFFVSNKGNDATMEDNDFVTEEDLDVVIKTDDTVNMVFTEEEMEKLNSHLDSEKDDNVFRGLNEKVYPYIKKLLSMKSIIRIPLLFITLLMVAFPPAYVIKGSIPLVVFITIVKYIFAFVQIYYPITRAFKLSNIRLKRSVVTFFVII